MESAHLRRGLKGKLVMSFYKAPNPSPAQYSGKVKPAPASTASVGYVMEEFRAPPLTEKVRMQLIAGDGEENVDKKAEDYISRMQARFRLEPSD